MKHKIDGEARVVAEIPKVEVEIKFEKETKELIKELTKLLGLKNTSQVVLEAKQDCEEEFKDIQNEQERKDSITQCFNESISTLIEDVLNELNQEE